MSTFQRVGPGKHFDAGKVSDVAQDRADSCMHCFTYERSRPKAGTDLYVGLRQFVF